MSHWFWLESPVPRPIITFPATGTLSTSPSPNAIPFVDTTPASQAPLGSVFVTWAPDALTFTRFVHDTGSVSDASAITYQLDVTALAPRPALYARAFSKTVWSTTTDPPEISDESDSVGSMPFVV